MAFAVTSALSTEAQGSPSKDERLDFTSNQVTIDDSKTNLIYFKDEDGILPEKYRADKTGVAALKVLIAALINKRSQQGQDLRTSRSFKKKKKVLLGMIAASQALQASPLVNTPSSAELQDFIEDIEEIAVLLGDSPPTTTDSLFSGTGESYFIVRHRH